MCVAVCKCGWWETYEQQDALRTDCGCCPSCGNENLEFFHDIKCQYADCKKNGTVRCHLWSWDDEKAAEDKDYKGEDFYEWFCCEHAAEHGYCYLCGEFFAGCEEFDFPKAYGNIPGLCSSCSDSVKTDTGEYDEPDEDEIFLSQFDPNEPPPEALNSR